VCQRSRAISNICCPATKNCALREPLFARAREPERLSDGNVYTGEGKTGGALCVACPIIQTVIFLPDAATISMTIPPRTYLRLWLSGIASSSMIRRSASASKK
jgi:hypothetical protein